MTAFNILNRAFASNPKFQSPAIVELGELDLDLIGGGTGDVVTPSPIPTPIPTPNP